jgi:hypothetical protein
MSIFEQRTLTCPHCAAQAEHTVAVSVNGGHAPQYRQQILEGSFQVITCATCGEKAEADGSFIYIDLRAKQWIGCFPRAREPAWRSYENEPLDSWRRSMIDHAPSNVRRRSDGFHVRAVFGLPALREKLLCFVHDIDDRVLEALKLDLMRGHPALVMHPDARPLLGDVGDASLVLLAHVPPSPAVADHGAVFRVLDALCRGGGLHSPTTTGRADRLPGVPWRTLRFRAEIGVKHVDRVSG